MYDMSPEIRSQAVELNFSTHQMLAIDKEIHELLRKGIVALCEH